MTNKYQEAIDKAKPEPKKVYGIGLVDPNNQHGMVPGWFHTMLYLSFVTIRKEDAEVKCAGGEALARTQVLRHGRNYGMTEPKRAPCVVYIGDVPMPGYIIRTAPDTFVINRDQYPMAPIVLQIKEDESDAE